MPCHLQTYSHIQRLKVLNIIFGRLPSVQPASSYLSPNNDSRRADSSSYKNSNNENDNNQLHTWGNNVLVFARQHQVQPHTTKALNSVSSSMAPMMAGSSKRSYIKAA